MLHRRDAVGEHTRALRDLLVGRRGGVADLHRAARTRTRWTRPAPTATTRPTPVPGDVLVYQVATRSDMTAWLARPARAGRDQLPQHHPGGVLRPVEQRDRPACRQAAMRRAGRPGPAVRPRHRGVRVRRRRAARRRLPGRPGGPGGQRAASRRPPPDPAVAGRPGRPGAPGGPVVAVGRTPGPQQGPRGHHRRAVRGPGHVGARRPPHHRRRARPSPHYAARPPPVRRRPRPGRRGRVRHPAERRRAGGALRGGRRAGDAVGARGVRGAPAGGHVPRRPGGGLRRSGAVRRGGGRRRACCSTTRDPGRVADAVAALLADADRRGALVAAGPGPPCGARDSTMRHRTWSRPCGGRRAGREAARRGHRRPARVPPCVPRGPPSH